MAPVLADPAALVDLKALAILKARSVLQALWLRYRPSVPQALLVLLALLLLLTRWLRYRPSVPQALLLLLALLALLLLLAQSCSRRSRSSPSRRRSRRPGGPARASHLPRYCCNSRE